MRHSHGTTAQTASHGTTGSHTPQIKHHRKAQAGPGIWETAILTDAEDSTVFQLCYTCITTAHENVHHRLRAR
jgi:hypothetical protein